MDKGYECHITFPRELGSQVEQVSIQMGLQSIGWKYSQIDGDPVLGQKVFCYLTCHQKHEEPLRNEMKGVMVVYRSRGLNPVRAKIEHIIYDERF